MTMHLARGLTTTNTKKRKQFRKPGWQKAHDEHNAYLMKMGAHPSQRTKENTKSGNKVPDYRIHQGSALCSNNIIGSTAKRKENRYTGDELIGIGVLHKSNSVPIRKDSNDAKEIARMRRG